MKTIAITVFGTRVSSRLDCAEGVLLVTLDGEGIKKREQVRLVQTNPWEKITTLLQLGIDVLICGGVPDIYANKLRDSGMQVVPWVRGEAEDVLSNFSRGQIEQTRVSAAKENMMRSVKLFVYLVLLAWPAVLAAQNAGEQTSTANKPPVTGANAQDSIKQKIAALEARIISLEQEKAKAEQQSEMEKLRKQAAEATAAETPAGETPETKIFASGERQQQSLNPNLSVTGDFIGYFSNLEAEEHAADEHGHGAIGGRQFMLREAEFHIVSNLDPYTRAKFFLGVPGGGTLHIGEAYMEFVNLPANLGLKIGKYRTQFGVLNRWHAHGLPQVDRPLVLAQFLGEGLSGFGIAGNVLLPKLWSHVNELDVEVIYGGDGVSFTNEGSKPWVAVGHLKNYYDLTTNAYLELGFSGAYGNNDHHGDFQTILAGVDLTYKWVPAGRSKYRTFEFRNELIFSRREGQLEEVNSLGFYSYIENKLNARWWAGLRFDYAQLPESNDENAWGLSPHLTFWQSEFVFMRLQFSHFKRHDGDKENVLLLQAVWSMGPHKHEAY